MHAPQNGVVNTHHKMLNQAMPMSAAGVPGPTTNLNIGMDYWGAPTSSAIPAMHGKVPSTAVAGGMVTAGSRDNVQSQLWLQVNMTINKMIANSLLKHHGCSLSWIMFRKCHGLPF